jgi:extracellular elastinolytic metalloproteinase
MGREIDRRDLSVNKSTSGRQNQLMTLAADESERLPGEHRVRITGFDATTGNPSAVRSESAPQAEGNYVQRALEHLQNIGGTLGLEATQAPEYAADPQIQQTSSGAVTVHAQQQYKGITIFDAAQAVRFAPDGTLAETVGSTVTVVQDLPVAPKLSVQAAVQLAAEYVATPGEDEQGATDQFGEPLPAVSVDLTGFQPQIIASFSESPARRTVLAAGPFGDAIKANLIWFPLDDNLRLSWETLITMPAYAGQYRTIVDAETGEILFCHQLIQTVAARGNVYLADGDSDRVLIDFPRTLADYQLPLPDDLPIGFPDTWVESDSTVGNCVFAHLGDNGPPSRGVLRNGVLTFDPADRLGDDQKVLNIFYLNCYIHDFFYMLGFRERDGNFQHDNLGRQGSAFDRVDARAHSGAVWGTANMATPVDGSSPVMNMGLVTSTDRHTAFDSGVVFHEFTHGVTNRLVGGPMNARALEADQSRGMGEGWGDYIACTINDTTVIGAWVFKRPGGLRRFAYDSNFPDTFANLGSGRYTEVHNIGEIWCATLMEMNRNLVAALGDRRRAVNLGVQLVVDALKLSPANPSFLDMRDSILAALESKVAAHQLTLADRNTVLRAIWTAFAKFGMGPQARSNGASLFGIQADFNRPVDLPEVPQPAPDVRVVATPELAIPDDDPAGIADTITVTQAGTITSFSVAINIEHTYIGDLRVSLLAPSGSAAVLHNREGASADNLVKTYTGANSPAIAALLGETIQGDWTLQIVDLEGQDIGILHRWSIEAGIEPVQAVLGVQPGMPSVAIPDDFQLINGIGPTMKNRLHNAGILTYAQLAALTPEEIIAKLGLSAMSAKNVVKQDWVGQARQLAPAPEQELTEIEALAEEQVEGREPIEAQNVDDSSVGRQHYATFTVELLLGEESEVRRTRVKHIQEGEQETWAGWEDGRLVSFFVEHASLRSPEGQTKRSIAPDAGSNELDDLSVEIGELNVSEAPSDVGGQIRGDLLRTEIEFYLSGLAAKRVSSEQIPYFIHILAYMTTTGETIVLAAMQAQLQPGVLQYAKTLDFAPPQVGHYQLLATVVLSDYNSVGAAIGPKLRVVP